MTNIRIPAAKILISPSFATAYRNSIHNDNIKKIITTYQTTDKNDFILRATKKSLIEAGGFY